MGHAASARLPEWLRAEWVEPVVRNGERLGTMVVLPEPLRWGRGSRGAYSRVAPRVSGSDVGGGTDQIVGTSPLLRQVQEKAKLLAEVDVPVLLLGETGVGKERFARLIHESGRRKAGPQR